MHRGEIGATPARPIDALCVLGNLHAPASSVLKQLVLTLHGEPVGFEVPSDDKIFAPDQIRTSFDPARLAKPFNFAALTRLDV